MKILIIGGTTFIGPVVVRQLVAMRHQVTVLSPGTYSRESSSLREPHFGRSSLPDQLPL